MIISLIIFLCCVCSCISFVGGGVAKLSNMENENTENDEETEKFGDNKIDGQVNKKENLKWRT